MTDTSATTAPPPAPDWQVRPARPDDVPALLELIRLLALYEREPDAVLTTESDLTRALFGPTPQVFAHVVEIADDDPAVGSPLLAGCAIWFVTFSTWEGQHGLWLEDLMVREEYRGRGFGVALLAELADVCLQRGYKRLEWNVLDWNTPALEVYRALGAVPLDDWTVHRLAGESLRSVAERRRGVSKYEEG